MHIYIFFQNILKWPKWHSKHVNFMDSKYAVCKDKFFTQSLFKSFLLVAGRSGHFSIFWRVHTTSELGKLLLSKSHFQHLEVSVTLLLQFKKNSDTGTLFFRVCQFLGMPKLQMEHTLLHYKILLNNYNCYSLIWSRKWLSSIYSIYI
jgi:hypothetical protein